MADESTHNSTMEEIEKVFNDKDFCQMFDLPRNDTPPGNVNENASSTFTTPDPLNTGFVDVTHINEQHSQISLSQQQQSQTTNEVSSAIRGLINTLIEQEHESIDLHSTTIPTMTSTGTMPKTPTMKSTGTMPKTPTMKSTGTMPRTPTMISTGTMPKTPIMKSTGTMPRTPTTTASSSGSVNEMIDLCSSTPSTIDLVSPTTGIINLCSPHTPTNPSSPN